MSPVPREELQELDSTAFAATEGPKRQETKTKLLQPTGEKLIEADKMPDLKDWMEVTSIIWKNTKQDSLGSEPRGLNCLQNVWTAPKETTTDGSTSLKAAIEDFCKKRNSQKVEKRGHRIYDRWDVSGLGILKRSSLWLSATIGPFDQCSEGTVEEKDCIIVLNSAMKSCDKEQSYTTGALSQGEGCIEYAIEVSSSIHEGDPPWDQHIKMFPPPETVRSDLIPASLFDSQIVCSKERGASGRERTLKQPSRSTVGTILHGRMDTTQQLLKAQLGSQCRGQTASRRSEGTTGRIRQRIKTIASKSSRITLLHKT